MKTIDEIKNKILLGDTYQLIKEIPDKSIDLIYIDIPYEYQYGGSCGCFGEKKKAQRESIIDIQSYDGIDYTLLDELVRVMKDIYIYIYMV